MKHLGRIVALLGTSALVFLTGCSTKEDIAVTGISIIPSSYTLGVDEAITLIADIQPAMATNKRVTWTSDDPGMKVITLNGSTVKGVADGSAVVTATTEDGGFTATCSITVDSNKISVQSISVTADGDTSLNVGDELTVTASVSPTNATEIDNIYWTSSDSGVASVSGKGLTAKVTAVSAGNATITANVDGKSASVSVKVSGSGSPSKPAPEGTVDMGLPSGIFWCEVNLGADSSNPRGTKEYWCDYHQYDKYNIEDELSLLEEGDDKATKALGADFRTPTLGEWAELLNPAYTTVKPDTQGGVNGYLVTSKKTKKTLFFPCEGSELYWSATGYWDVISDEVFRSDYACSISIKDLDVEGEVFMQISKCHVGENQHYIRPVCGKRPVKTTGITVSKKKVEVKKGENVKLSASVQPSSASQTVIWASTAHKLPIIWTGETSLVSNRVDRVYAVDGTCGFVAWTELYPKLPSKKPEAVDLGLPSGTKWASFDLGASAPEESGIYFAWGETETKWQFIEQNYKWYDMETASFTKYGTTNRTLETADDAAAKLLGGSWRIPTPDQVEELMSRTTMETVTQNGVKGKLVKGPNKKTIFLPFGGYVQMSKLKHEGDGFYYMTNTSDKLSNSRAMTFHFSEENGMDISAGYRDEFGLCIRPVTK